LWNIALSRLASLGRTRDEFGQSVLCVCQRHALPKRRTTP
jgi:hypothetical protein